MTIRSTSNANRDLRSGQTLVIAVIILGVLLILGTAFATIIYRNINETGRSQSRSVATDLARAGAEYAHYQLRYSELGADWRPALTPPAMDANGFTKDPDALYLRPADPTRPFSDDPKLAAVPDMGGPDGYGPYSRVFFDKGRVLVRVRFAPSQFDAFANPNGQLREPGKARSYLTIEVVGRPGKYSPNDPTLQLPEYIQVSGFANLTSKTAAIAELKQVDNTLQNTRKMMAFCSIGIIETARYITNINNVTSPAELGFPNSRTTGNATPFDQANSGVSYGDNQAPYAQGEERPVEGRMVWGVAYAEPNPGKAKNWQTVPGLGSLYCNAGLKIFGLHDVVLDTFMGESWDIAGSISAANSEAMVELTRTYYDKANDLFRSDWNANGSSYTTPFVLTGPALDSNQPAFYTYGGTFRDGSSSPDSDGYVRGIARKEPPSILTVDPQTKLNRFLALTRESGRVVNGRIIGRFGFGNGVYVDSSERGNTNSEDEEQVSGAVKSLPADWLNPNNSSSQGWKGPYYIPLASSLRLLPDGFEIIRDTRSRNAYWRNPNGTSTNSTFARFRVRTFQWPINTGPMRTMILDSIQHPELTTKPGSTLADSDFVNYGTLFNGVLYFEGDVRVRGVVPTDNQLTVVSMGSIYVDGSVTKGVIDEKTGAVLSRPSKSSIMLAARDYVCLNTTMFVGPAPGESVEEKNANSVPDTPNPFELRLDAPNLTLETQFLLDPNTPSTLGGNPVNPSTWRPFANHYQEVGTNTALDSNLLFSSSADDNGPSFVSLDVAPSSYALAGGWGSYLFPRLVTFGTNSEFFNAASGFFGGVGNIPVYGLGNPTLNSYPKFETIEFPIVSSSFNFNGRWLTPTLGTTGAYNLAVQDPTLLRLRLNGVGQSPTKNYLAAHTAIAPHDVIIEAAMYAEQGSFFVIPGNWFNTNTQDNRHSWLDRSAGSLYAGMNDDQANQRRFDLFGHTPAVPFYAEPLDIRVSIVGSISENMPAPISDQAEWLKKWGWIPRMLGSTGHRIPSSHTSGYDPNVVPTLPNLTVSYDPAFGNAAVWNPSANVFVPLRTDDNGWVLPPMPRLPVSPTLAYFGEVNP